MPETGTETLFTSIVKIIYKIYYLHRSTFHTMISFKYCQNLL